MSFIVIEGGEGSGKSTQAARLARALGAVLTREPGGTQVGEQIRAVLLDPESGALDPRAEALLMAAARAQHVVEVIRPALAAGRTVVCDRYAGSSYAYQGYGRGLALSDLRCLSGWAADGLEPDLVILLDVPAEVAASRIAGQAEDRLESERGGFHDRVRLGFRQLAGADPDRWAVVDGTGPVEEVAARVGQAHDRWSGGSGR
ncbi:MAG TPA: dTMP kinase [Acidimicrobiales bacterium]